MGKSKYYLVMLLFSFIIAFLLHLLLFATAPMATIIMQDMTLSHAGFGFIFSAAMVSLIIFRIPWGLIGDRIGYLNALRIALLISAASALLRAFSSEYLTMLFSQFFLGVGLAAILPCLSLLVKEWAHGTTGLSTGIYIAGFAAGNAAALGLTPYLLEIMPWRDVLLLYGGVAIVVCGLWWALGKSLEKTAPQFQIRNFTGILRDRYVWILVLFMAVAMGSYDTMATWMPKLLEIKQFDTRLASLLPLGFFTAGPITGLILDRFRNRRAFVTLFGTVAAISILGVNYAPFPLLLPCMFLSGFAATGVLTVSLTAPTEHERLSVSPASVVGITSSLGNIGPLIMPVAFGFLIDITGAFQISVLMVAVIIGVVCILGARGSE